jgi:hypothetical protein
MMCVLKAHDQINFCFVNTPITRLLCIPYEVQNAPDAANENNPRLVVLQATWPEESSLAPLHFHGHEGLLYRKDRYQANELHHSRNYSLALDSHHARRPGRFI